MASKEILPPNVDSDGRIVGGMIRQKNLIEAALVAVFLFAVSKLFLFAVPVLIKYLIIASVGIPSILICIIGIGDLSVSEWFLDKLAFKKSRNVYPFKIPTKKEKQKQGLFFKKKKE